MNNLRCVHWFNVIYWKQMKSCDADVLAFNNIVLYILNNDNVFHAGAIWEYLLLFVIVYWSRVSIICRFWESALNALKPKPDVQKVMKWNNQSKVLRSD